MRSSLSFFYFVAIITSALLPLFSSAQGTVQIGAPSGYSSQYYDWEPLSYFEPKYSGYLNQQEPTVYLVPQITFEKTDSIARSLGFELEKKFFTGIENDSATLAGYLKRNDAHTVDLKLVTYNTDGAVLYESKIIRYNKTSSTATDNDQDLLPFLFTAVPVENTSQYFVVKDYEHNQVLFGPMKFSLLSGIGTYSKVSFDEKSTLEESTPFNPYEQWWFYKRPDAKPIEYFPTEKLCLASVNDRFPGKGIVCSSTISYSVQVRLDMVRTKFKGQNKRLVFAVDTRGTDLILAADFSTSSTDENVVTVLGVPRPVTTNTGEYKLVEIPLGTGTSEGDPYYVKIYNQETRQLFFSGYINPTTSQLTKIFSNNSIITKSTSDSIAGLAISSELDTPASVPNAPDLDFIDNGVLQNPLSGSNVSNLVEFIQLLFRKLPLMVRPALLLSIAMFGLNLIIHAKKMNAAEAKGKIYYILLGSAILLGTYAIGTVLSAVVRCFTGTSC